MIELLTTGQMIDRLKVGEVAVDKLGNKIFMEKDNSLRTLPNEEIVTMTDFTVLSKWRILPNYVSFEEAMNAVKEGKKVSYYTKFGQYLDTFSPSQTLRTIGNGVTNFKELVNCKWAIEGDKND